MRTARYYESVYSLYCLRSRGWLPFSTGRKRPVGPLPKVLDRGSASVADKTGAFLFLHPLFFRPGFRLHQKACPLDSLHVALVCRKCRHKLVRFALFFGVVEHHHIPLFHYNKRSPFRLPAPFFAEFLVSLLVIPFVELLKVVTELEVKDPSVLQLPNHDARRYPYLFCE